MPSTLGPIVALASMTLPMAGGLAVVLTAVAMASAGSGGAHTRRWAHPRQETPEERYSRRDVRVDDG